MTTARPLVTYQRRLKGPRHPLEARYVWHVRFDGKLVGSAGTKENAKRLAARLLDERRPPTTPP
jgi:hypothetical protein